mgnify:CR=1 FL=1
MSDLPSGNEPLRIRSGGEFAKWVKARAGAFPGAYRTIKGIGKKPSRPYKRKMKK